jgi:hypothetical protein
MDKSLLRSKKFVGMLYGMVAGLAFSIFAWGIDAVLLASSHGALPWVKILPGLIFCVLSGGLVGWLTIRFESHLLALALWVALAFFFSRLIIWIPLKITPIIIRLLDSDLGAYLKYPYYDSLNQNAWFSFGAIVIVALICGLLEINLVEQALFSSGSFAVLVPLLLCFFGFALVGKTSDSMLNQQIREPVLAVDDLLQFAVENIDQEVPGDVARSMHLGATNTIKDYLPLERRIIMSNFDESIGQVDVLVDFSGIWVRCTAIYSQVTYCKPAVNTPGTRFLNIARSIVSLNGQAGLAPVLGRLKRLSNIRYRFMLY